MLQEISKLKTSVAELKNTNAQIQTQRDNLLKELEKQDSDRNTIISQMTTEAAKTKEVNDATIAQYESEMSNLNAEMSRLKEEVSRLNTDITRINNEMNAQTPSSIADDEFDAKKSPEFTRRGHQRSHHAPLASSFPITPARSAYRNSIDSQDGGGTMVIFWQQLAKSREKELQAAMTAEHNLRRELDVWINKCKDQEQGKPEDLGENSDDIRLQQLQSNINDLVEQINAKEQSLNEALTQIEVLSSQNQVRISPAGNEIDKAIEDIREKRQQDALKVEERKRKELEATLIRMKESYAKMENKLRMEEERRMRAIEQYSQEKSSVEMLRNQLKAAQTDVDDLTRASLQLEQLKAEGVGQNDRVMKLKYEYDKQVEALNEEVHSLSSKIDTLSAESAAKDDQLTALRDDRTKMMEKITQLNVEVQRLTVTNSELIMARDVLMRESSNKAEHEADKKRLADLRMELKAMEASSLAYQKAFEDGMLYVCINVM